MSIRESKDQEADKNLEDDQSDRPRLVVKTGEYHLGEPLMIDPGLPASAIGVDIGRDDRTGSENVLAEADVSPEVGVGDGVAKPEKAEAGKQGQSGEDDGKLRSSKSHSIHRAGLRYVAIWLPKRCWCLVRHHRQRAGRRRQFRAISDCFPPISHNK